MCKVCVINVILYIGESKARGSLSFQALPLSSCYLLENEEGFIDTDSKTVDFLNENYNRIFLSDYVYSWA